MSNGKVPDCRDIWHEMGLTPEEKQQVEDNSNEVVYSAGETIIKQGTFASHIFVLKTGLAKVVREGENNKRLAYSLLAPPAFFGFSALQAEYFYFGVEAMKDASICQIRKEMINGIIDHNPKANRYYRDWCGRQNRELFTKLEITSTRNNHGKLASTLYSLCGEKYEKEGVFEVITRRDLAELASISRESANKILKELENDRIIEINQRSIEIRKPELLRRLSLIG